jgi:hypothetical protein
VGLKFLPSEAAKRLGWYAVVLADFLHTAFSGFFYIISCVHIYGFYREFPTTPNRFQLIKRSPNDYSLPVQKQKIFPVCKI